MSVCIVHRDGWAVCDSRGNVNTCGITPCAVKKGFIVDDFTIVTTVGEAVVSQDLEELLSVNQSTDVPTFVSAYFKDNEKDSSVLLVNRRRQIVQIEPLGYRMTLDPKHSFWAAGCAAQSVIGYLKAIEALKGKVTKEDAKEAIQMASEFDSGIDDRCQVFELTTMSDES